MESAKTMPNAVPGVGECTICFEVVPCVKVLDCAHCICIPCAGKLVQEAQQPFISCPECRQNTDCSHGLGYLKTRYFGDIRCDVCLDKKPAEDMWWCAECVQALCSKCSIKEHSTKKHTISEWNKMEPVQFSVNYINEIEYIRQASTGSEANRKAVKAYLQEVEKMLLEKNLTIHPELDEIRQSLFTRYGNRFSTETPPSTPGGIAASSGEGRKVVAKVLQLAGANILETIIPSQADQKFQVYFTIPPAEMAQYIRSKIEFIPFEQSESPPQASDVGDQIDRNSIEAQSFQRTGSKAPVLQVDYAPKDNLVVLRMPSEVQLYNLKTGQNYTIPMPGKQLVRSLCLGGGSAESGELLVALQSCDRKYQWSLESYQIAKLPVSSLYSADFDIDPEDNVEALHIADTGEPCVIYEMRQCADHVSEIWRATMTKKKGKVKLKETLVYQRGEARYSALKVLDASKATKLRIMFVWDELSSCLYRLMIKEGRCEHSTKVLHSVAPIPYALDEHHHLWLYDPHLNQLCISSGDIVNRVNVTFREVCKYFRHSFQGLWMVKENIIGVCVTPTTINVVTFKKF